MDTHVKVVGVLNIVWGAVGLLGACIVFFMLGGVAGMVAVLEESPDAALVVSILSVLAVAIAGLIALLSLPCLIVGYGLLRLRGWARVLGIVLSILHLLEIPFGTALGVYGLVVLLNERTGRLFDPAGAGALPSRPVSV